jgi:hypothetical protein
MVLQIANITKDRPELFHLLEEAYHKIYVPAFPDDDERESLEKFMKAIDGGFPGVGIAVNILGENLQDPDNYVLKGISIAYYYEKQGVGLLAYNAISPEHRERGLGKLMVQSRIDTLKDMAAEKGQTLNAVFIEVNDPEKVTPEMDSMDPKKRVAIFTDWGAKLVPIDYVQPPVSKDTNYCENLRLMNYPVDGKYADKKGVESLLRAMYRDYREELVREEGKPDRVRIVRAEDDPVFRKMKAQLDVATIRFGETNEQPGYMVGAPRFDFLRAATPDAAPHAVPATGRTVKTPAGTPRKNGPV